jgi:hypothetical protein
MNFVNTTLAAAALLVGLAACNSGGEKADEVEALANKMCACADVECAKKVDTEVTEWATKNKGTKVGKAAFERVQAAGKKMVECGKKHGDANAEKLDDDLPQSE